MRVSGRTDGSLVHIGAVESSDDAVGRGRGDGADDEHADRALGHAEEAELAAGPVLLDGALYRQMS